MALQPKGTIYRAQAASTVVELEVDQGTTDAGRDVIHLLPDGKWWVAWWCDEFIAVDICVPPRLIDGEWRLIDLEIDLAAFRDRRVEVTDEEEFASACDTSVISPTQAESAKAAALEMEVALPERAEPFGRVGWSRMAFAVDLGLPPIKVLTHDPA